MKKALLFIGLAMCTSFAFAQTNNFTPNAGKDVTKMTVSMKKADVKPADYKASIFAKPSGDTIKVWSFTGSADDMPVVYGASGRVTAGMVVAGEELEVNAQTNDCATWQYVPDTNWFNGDFFNENYSYLSAGWRAVVGWMIDDLGEGQFMLMSLLDPVHGTGSPHAYMSFAPVARPTDAAVINIAFKQEFRKFYDQSFIDYKVGNNWNTREVNVEGVDAEINSWGAVNRLYTMPLELGQQDNIEIRFRYKTQNRSNAYGYFWAVDDIAIIAGGANDWVRYGQDFVDGVYGTMPQGMTIPMTWVSSVANTGANARNNITVTANHIDADGTSSPIASQACGNMAAGDASQVTNVYLNERGFINPSDAESFGSAGWFAYGTGTYGQATIPSTYQKRGVPTTTTGVNTVQVSASSQGAEDLTWPAIGYRVVGNTNNPINQNLERGYRWGHDNGVIASGQHAINNNYTASYILGNTREGEETYVTDSGNFGSAGYWVSVRYTTGSDIPTDANGQPWVFRGVEIVTSSEFSAVQLDGTNIVPIALRDEYTEDSLVSFNSVNTGVNSMVYTLSGSELENELETGYKIANEEGDYNAVNIFFPEQPEMLPNTSFRFGYQLAQDALFAAAATTRRIVMPSDDGTGYQTVPYDSIEALAPYANQFTPNVYDVYLSDPQGNNRIWGGAYNTTYPMIRAIIGPKVDLPTHSLFINCNDDQVIMEYIDEDVCGQELAIAQGSAPTIYIYPGDDHAVLDDLFIDGERVVPATEDDVDGDPNFVTDGDYTVDTIIEGYSDPWVLLQRNYWTYTFEPGDTAAHTISATSHQEEWQDLGVDPVAADVIMILAPNPANQQVKLALSGVSGMVNCNIIDMSGRVVYSKVINAEQSNTIDLSNVPTGAYFVRITNDSFSKVEKLIVR